MPAQTTCVPTSTASGLSAPVTSTGLAFWHNGPVAVDKPTRSFTTSGRTTSRTAVPAPTTSVAPTVDSLHIAELAVAIQAAGLPKAWRELSPAQLRDLARDGLNLLGYAELSRRDIVGRRLVCDSRFTDREYRRIWPTARQSQDAHDAAWRVYLSRQDSAVAA